MNPARKLFAPSVPYTLEYDGENETKQQLHLKLSFNFNVFALIEKKTGLNMLKGELFRGNNLNAGNLLVALWASIQVNHPEFGDDDGLAFLGSALSLANSATAGTALKEAFLLSLGKEQREAIRVAEEEEARKAAAGDTDPLAEQLPATS
jgi:hypothetical protein